MCAIMCELCRLVESAKNPNTSEAKIYHTGPFCIIIDSLGDKPTKDGFTRKLAIYRQHHMDPITTTKEAIVEIARQIFPTRKFWFPQTEDNTEKGKRLPLRELAAHWYIIIE